MYILHVPENTDYKKPVESNCSNNLLLLFRDLSFFQFLSNSFEIRFSCNLYIFSCSTCPPFVTTKQRCYLRRHLMQLTSTKTQWLIALKQVNTFLTLYFVLYKIYLLETVVLSTKLYRHLKIHLVHYYIHVQDGYK